MTIERKDVGVTLEITPQVLDNNLIRLDVRQEITAIAENVAQTIGSGNSSIPVGPTTTNEQWRPLRSCLINRPWYSGGPYVTMSRSMKAEFRCFGIFPASGSSLKACRSRNRSKRSNLLVFLTPTVVRDRVDMVEMSEKKRGEIEPLLKENRIDETPQVNRALDRLITAPQAEKRAGIGHPTGNFSPTWIVERV